MFQTTRRRLAIWYTTVTAIVLLMFAIGMYIYVRGTLIERIDDTLNHVVEVVSRSISIERVQTPGVNGELQINVGASFQDNSDRIDDDRIDLEVFNLSGKLLWSTLKEPLDLPVWIDLDGSTVRVGNNAMGQNQRILRQITAPISSIDGRLAGFLRVSHPWFEVTKPTELLTIDLTIGICLVLTSVAAIGWLLSGIAIEPVKASYQQLKQFTADASHELRNPIATIQTNVQVALGEEPLAPQQRQQLQTIERLTRRLGKLVDDLLFLARQDSSTLTPQFCPVPLDALLMETIEEQQLAAAARGIALTLEIVDPIVSAEDKDIDAFSILGDWDRLARLFTNLLTNAIQYTPPQDTHSGFSAMDRSEIKVQLKQIFRQNTAYLQVKVSDTGIGIPDTALPHLFDRFYRVDPARTATASDVSSGSGLGLAIVQSIVASHQGELSIESQVNVGTTVTAIFKAVAIRSS
ncbi:sensor histidine kinase [Chamaesiphon minutus]|uniref:histidine kinase n=1 Tax=Chamaesiphon minutus (strain ATCC 27169 / PCC 6605) TaxID=1173020 RepID=K9UB08_CHAP6|nr:HAMP domain-containing sensor histidine kinase [Chamaesiphon minutus]AFY91798.1 signal transduction histidine kinase [Chamaesiphon minutus PCC 6605]